MAASSVLGAPRPATNERSILSDVDREALQVAERRVAGAEVVDAEPHAERLERVQRLDGRARRPPSSRVSVISRQSAAGSTPVSLRALPSTVVDEVGVGELARREVHRDR